MQRREFCRLAGGTLILIPAGLFLVRAIIRTPLGLR